MYVHPGRCGVGDVVGLTLGDRDGLALGTGVGLWLGLADGDALGEREGIIVGDCDGDVDGEMLGLELGLVDGLALGLPDGLVLGDADGLALGLALGDTLGEDDGDADGCATFAAGRVTSLSKGYPPNLVTRYARYILRPAFSVTEMPNSTRVRRPAPARGGGVCGYRTVHCTGLDS